MSGALAASPHRRAILIVGKPDFAETTAFRDSGLQGAYFIIAARALGLDCGPDVWLRGDRPGVLPGRTRVKPNFVCAIGARRSCGRGCAGHSSSAIPTANSAAA